MKKILLFFFFIIFCVSTVVAVEPKIDTLTKIENSVLGLEYTGDNLEKRLARLEEYIFGAKQKGNNNIRLKKIIESAKYNLLEEDTTLAENSNDYYIEPYDNTVNYPVLDDVEQRLGLKKKTDNLSNRLAVIENKIFNKTYDKETFFDRVERIKSKIYNGNSLAYSSEDDKFSYSDRYENSNDGRSTDNTFFNKGSLNVRYKLSVLEKKLLKNTFNDETNNDRLARLENVMFETSFYNDDEQDRIERLESVVRAQKSSPKYDSNKFQQGLSTAMQIGTMVLMVLAFIL